jgi:hypothetical protein
MVQNLYNDLQKSLYSTEAKSLAPRHGFEPRFTAPKAAVLPLDDRGISAGSHQFSAQNRRIRNARGCAVAGTSRSRIDQRPKGRSAVLKTVPATGQDWLPHHLNRKHASATPSIPADWRDADLCDSIYKSCRTHYTTPRRRLGDCRTYLLIMLHAFLRSDNVTCDGLTLTLSS